MSDVATGTLGQMGLSSEAMAVAFIVQRLAASHIHVQLVQVKAVKPAGIDALTSTVGTVDVQPMVHQIDGTGKTYPHGIVHGLPYFRLQGGNVAIIMDPVVGDIGIAIFCDRDISAAAAAKTPSKPGSRRRFDWADGLYIGGVLGQAPQHILALSQPGVSDPSRGIVGAQGIVLSSNLPVQIIGDLHVSGAVIAGYGGSDAVGLQTHVHTQNPDAHGDAEVPTNPPTPGL